MLMVMHVQVTSQNIQANPYIRQRKLSWGAERCEATDSNCQEKVLSNNLVPVPQTDTGRQEENSKTRGRTFVKELGKIIP